MQVVALASSLSDSLKCKQCLLYIHEHLSGQRLHLYIQTTCMKHTCICAVSVSSINFKPDLLLIQKLYIYILQVAWH